MPQRFQAQRGSGPCVRGRNREGRRRIDYWCYYEGKNNKLFETHIKSCNVKKDALFGDKTLAPLSSPRLRLPTLVIRAHNGYITSRGMRVAALNPEDGVYYPGMLEKPASARYAMVRMAHGVRKVPVKSMMYISGAMPCPPLQAKNHALVLVPNKKQGCLSYLPCKIEFTPEDLLLKGKLYTVKLYDGREVIADRNSLLKISGKKFDEIVSRLNRTELNEGEPVSQPHASPSGGSPPDEPGSPSVKHVCPRNDNEERQRPVQRLVDGQGETRETTETEVTEMRSAFSGFPPIPSETNQSTSDPARAPGKEARAKEEDPDIPYPLYLRSSLPKISGGEEVVARFSIDGWYLKGTVLRPLGDHKYEVVDCTGFIEAIWREDILTQRDHAPPLKKGDQVVAKHPLHRIGFAPAEVLSVDEVCQEGVLKFFDGEEQTVFNVNIYRLPKNKYKHDVLYIQGKHLQIRGMSAVIRNDETGEYVPGYVQDTDKRCAYMFVTVLDGSVLKQCPVHIFCAMSRQLPQPAGKYVLAPADPVNVVFLPGKITNLDGDMYEVLFCNERVGIVNRARCYTLSEQYYLNATWYWKRKHSRHT